MFINNLLNGTKTLNGAKSNKSSMNKCLDLFSMGVSTDLINKEKLISDALMEDPIVATMVIFHLRDCRGGQGNKDIMRVFHKVVNEKLSSYDEFYSRYISLIPYLPIVGSWKDVYDLYGANKKLNEAIITYVNLSLNDLDQLCAKWFPMQSQFHKDFAKHFDLGLGHVRRNISGIRSTVEQKMCAKKWHEINYEHVPSLANKKYAKAFDRNDKSRYDDYLEKVLDGEKKANSGQLYPHQIAAMCKINCGWNANFKSNKTADALWKELPNYMEKATNILPVIDCSGSMFSTISGGNEQCIDVAAGLGIYFAERNNGSYKDVWCNFSTKPRFYKLKGNTISEKYKNLNYSNWGMSTDLQAVFDVILDTYEQDRKSSEVPKSILIVSDMEFDRCQSGSTNFKEAKIKFNDAGLDLPTIIFWRVDVTSFQQPVTQHESGSILINGYSPAIMKIIVKMDIDEMKNITPLNMMYKAIEKYNYIKEAMN